VQTTALALPRPWQHLGFWFFLQLTTAPLARFGQPRDAATGACGDALLVGADGSWCEIAASPGEDGRHVVREGGPERLWRIVEDSYTHWRALGEPAWDRFGVNVAGAAQFIWLDDPDTGWRWPVPAAPVDAAPADFAVGAPAPARMLIATCS
jgi:hypothetical protein